MIARKRCYWLLELLCRAQHSPPPPQRRSIAIVRSEGDSSATTCSARRVRQRACGHGQTRGLSHPTSCARTA